MKELSGNAFPGWVSMGNVPGDWIYGECEMTVVTIGFHIPIEIKGKPRGSKLMRLVEKLFNWLGI